MERSEALKYCRYYHEEEECPFSYAEAASMFWSIEEGWIKLCTGKGSELRANNYAAEFIAEFPDGIPGIDIPIGLKAAMYNQFMHYNNNKSGYVDFLLAYGSATEQYSSDNG